MEVTNYFFNEEVLRLNMADTNAMLLEFAKFAEQIQIKGRKPSEEDIDKFLDNFFDTVRVGWQYGDAYIYTANKMGPDGKPLYDRGKKSYQELLDEAKPILTNKVLETYQGIEDSFEAFDWITTPMSIEDYALAFAKESGDEKEFLSLSGVDRRNHKAFQKAVSYIGKIKYRIKQYMKTVMPFTARVTMYHPLHAILYHTESGNSEIVHRNFTIDSEEKLNNFVTGKTTDGFPSADHNALRSIFWTPSVSNKNLKMGVVDIDNPSGKISQAELSKTAKKVNKRLTDLEHPTIIMYTGSSYQIWFGQNDREEILNYREMKDYLTGVLFEFGSFDRDESIDLEVPYLDLATNSGPLRTFFSLHYPTSSDPNKKYTGLAAVPVAPEDLEKFNPAVDAHPEEVLANFNVYSNYVAAFYDRVQIGQDYESPDDIEAPPSCSRLEEKFADHKLLKSYLIQEPDINKIEYRNAGTALEDEEKVYAHAVSRGVLAVLVYEPSGSIAPSGMLRQRVIKTKSGTKVVSEAPKAFYITKDGLVVYDDYICRDLERLCESKKIRSAVLVGRISAIDTFGNEEGEANTRFKLIAKNGIRPTDARVMRFTVSRAPIVNNASIPTNIMGEQIKEFTTKRITPTEYFELEDPIGKKIKTLFNSFLRGRKSGAMMIYGKEKYLLTSTRTLTATIVGIDKASKVYSGKEIPPVWIALGKKSQKFGLQYIIVAKAQIALPREDRIKLRELVEGEDGSNIIPLPRAFETDKQMFAATAASVVVEISYDDVSNYKIGTVPFAYSQGKFRATTSPLTINPLINAKVIGIREDLNHKRLSDINIRQEPLIEPDMKLDSAGSLLAALPNPNKPLPEFIRRNSAFFGVPQKLTIERFDAWPAPPSFREDGRGNKITTPNNIGGRKVDIPLIEQGPFHKGQRLPGEMQAAYKRWEKNEPGYQVFVDARTLQKTPSPHYRVTSLGDEFNNAIDDPYGAGQDGNLVTSFSGEIEDIRTTHDVMEIAHLINKEQAKEDSKLYVNTFKIVPGDINSEEPDYRRFDKGYQEAYSLYNKQLRNAIGPTKFGKASTEMLIQEVMSNPQPVRQDALDMRVAEYIEEFNKWTAIPQPKQSWEDHALGKFIGWEVPILEKERLMNEAKNNYKLTEEEAAMVDMNYVKALTDNPFESLLSDLYEVPRNDIESEPAAV